MKVRGGLQSPGRTSKSGGGGLQSPPIPIVDTNNDTSSDLYKHSQSKGRIEVEIDSQNGDIECHHSKNGDTACHHNGDIECPDKPKNGDIECPLYKGSDLIKDRKESISTPPNPPRGEPACPPPSEVVDQQTSNKPATKRSTPDKYTGSSDSDFAFPTSWGHKPRSKFWEWVKHKASPGKRKQKGAILTQQGYQTLIDKWAPYPELFCEAVEESIQVTLHEGRSRHTIYHPLHGAITKIQSNKSLQAQISLEDAQNAAIAAGEASGMFRWKTDEELREEIGW